MLRCEILGEQRDTDIEPGDVLVLEGGLGKEVLPDLDIGATGYHMRQTSQARSGGWTAARVRAAWCLARHDEAE